MREFDCWDDRQALSDYCRCTIRMNKRNKSTMGGRITWLLAGATGLVATFVLLCAFNVIDAPSIEILDALDLSRLAWNR